MATSEQSVSRLQGIDRRQVVLTAAAVAAAAVAAVYIIRQRRKRRTDADDGAPSVGQPAADAAATAPAQPGAGSATAQAEDGVAGTAARETGTSSRWCWSEDEADVIVESAASGAKSARDISVKFEPRHLALSVCGEQIIDGDLPNAVHADECSWQFEGQGKDRRVVLTLVKALAAIRWDQVVLNSSA